MFPSPLNPRLSPSQTVRQIWNRTSTSAAPLCNAFFPWQLCFQICVNFWVFESFSGSLGHSSALLRAEWVGETSTHADSSRGRRVLTAGKRDWRSEGSKVKDRSDFRTCSEDKQKKKQTAQGRWVSEGGESLTRWGHDCLWDPPGCGAATLEVKLAKSDECLSQSRKSL